MYLLGLALGAYATLVGAVYLGQRRIMYPAPRIVSTPAIDDASLESIEIPGGSPTFGLHFKAERSAPTLLHFHGNGEQIADLIAIGRALHARGLGFFAMEYPGYGLAAGSPSEAANYLAAESTLTHLREQHGIAKHDVILQGQSLGTGIAIEMARRGHGSRLVLISPYTSMVAMGKLTLPIFPNEWLVHDRYLNAEKAPELSQPALVIHGTDDEVIPARMGQRIAELLPNARLISIAGGRHNDLFVIQGRQLLDAICEFSRAEK
jgi:uncharacterized protein